MVADTDADGVSDLEEKRRFADPRNGDTDNDLISDGDELSRFYSSPIHQDTDTDGMEEASPMQA